MSLISYMYFKSAFPSMYYVFMNIAHKLNNNNMPVSTTKHTVAHTCHLQTVLLNATDQQIRQYIYASFNENPCPQPHGTYLYNHIHVHIIQKYRRNSAPAKLWTLG